MKNERKKERRKKRKKERKKERQKERKKSLGFKEEIPMNPQNVLNSFLRFFSNGSVFKIYYMPGKIARAQQTPTIQRCTVNIHFDTFFSMGDQSRMQRFQL